MELGSGLEKDVATEQITGGPAAENGAIASDPFRDHGAAELF